MDDITALRGNPRHLFTSKVHNISRFVEGTVIIHCNLLIFIVNIITITVFYNAYQEMDRKCYFSVLDELK
jgi:hypothetical protein